MMPEDEQNPAASYFGRWQQAFSLPTVSRHASKEGQWRLALYNTFQLRLMFSGILVVCLGDPIPSVPERQQAGLHKQQT
jgi:hypothetical protein